MLYLAEVRKQVRFMGGPKAELKLLACQRNDQTWSAIPGEEIREVEEASQFENGVLVLIDFGANRQVQGKPELAAPKLAGMLQNFSRLLEKTKTSEEKIEQWRQSLTYQSEELMKQRMEMEARLEQIEQMEEERELIVQQQQELEANKEEIEKFKGEYERKKAELEGAWEHLRGEQRRLEEQMGEVSNGAILDDELSEQIQLSLARLLDTATPTDSLQEQVRQTLELVNQQQTIFDRYWQQLEQQRAQAQQQQSEVEQQKEKLHSNREDLQQVQHSLAEAQKNLQQQQQSLLTKQESLGVLRSQLQNQKDLYETLSRLAVTPSGGGATNSVDIQALENMPLGELQAIVDNLKQDLEKVVRFVNDQEEELTLERQELEELKGKIETASEYDRLTLEQELSEIQDRYQMLDETLFGQRRNLREREAVFKLHSQVLRRRQGIVDLETNDSTIDLTPVLEELAGQRDRTQEAVDHLESEIEQMHHSVEQAQEMFATQMKEQEAKVAQLNELQEQTQQMQDTLTQLWSYVKTYEETLQPLQDSVDQLRGQLDHLISTFSQFQGTQEDQQQAISQIQQSLGSLTA